MTDDRQFAKRGNEMVPHESGNAVAPEVTVIVPTRNEAANVTALHEQIERSLAGQRWELLFVDDSDDETPRVVESLQATDARVRLLHRPRGSRTAGLGGAVTAGFAVAAGVIFVVMDGDLQHPPSVVPQMMAALADSNADIVVATRYSAHGSAHGLENGFRVAASKWCRRLTHAALERARGTSDPLGGFFALRREVIERSELQPDGYKILLEILVRGEWRGINEVPYEFQSRLAGASKSGMAEARRFLRHLRALRKASRTVELGSRRRTRRGTHDNAPRRPGAAPAPLRTMIFTSEAPPVISGISTTVAALTSGLRKRGHEVDIVTRADFPRLMRREIRLSAFALFWPKFRHQLRHYDVVNVHGPVPTMSEVFLLLARTLHIHRPAIVYTHHSDLAIPRLDRWCAIYNRISGRLAHTADTVVVSSADYEEKMRRTQGAPVEVVPWGVHAADMVLPRIPRVDGVLRVLFVGQLRPYKGISVLMDAVADLPNVEVTVVGDGPMRGELEAHAATLPFGNVAFRGRVSDVELWQAYSSHDVIVLPSTTTAEAFGLVLAEGMAAGCVPVASDLPGVRTVARPTGLVVTPGDVADLRRAFVSLSSDPARLERMRKSSVERAQQFSMDATAERYESVFRAASALTAGRQGAIAVPSAWERPELLLEAVTASIGGSRASLSLLGRDHGEFSPLRVWTNDLEPIRVSHAPVATYVARLNKPVLIRPDIALHPELKALLRRPSLTSSILVPVARTRKSVSIVGVATSTDDVHFGPEDVEAIMSLVAQ